MENLGREGGRGGENVPCGEGWGGVGGQRLGRDGRPPTGVLHRRPYHTKQTHKEMRRTTGVRTRSMTVWRALDDVISFSMWDFRVWRDRGGSGMGVGHWGPSCPGEGLGRMGGRGGGGSWVDGGMEMLDPWMGERDGWNWWRWRRRRWRWRWWR